MAACGQKPTEKLVLATAVQAENATSKYGGHSKDTSYSAVLEALKLTDDPASPSDLVSDENYRNKLKDEFIREINETTCTGIQVNDTLGIEDQSGYSVYVVQYTLAKYTQSFHALVTIPKQAGAYPLMLYSSSGFEIPNKGNELKSLLGRQLSNMVTASPVYGNEPFLFVGKNYQDAPAGPSYIGDVDRTYGLALCLQTNHATLKFSGKTLGSLLQLSKNDFPGFRTIGSGSGRGGLVMSLTLARAGAALLGSLTDAEKWARFDCGLLVNPLHSFYAAEARLSLAALIRGNTEETKYPRIPGYRQMRYEIFHGYRNGTLGAQDVAFQIAKRDAFITAPFVNMALKNLTLEPDDKGPKAGGLLVLHGSNRNDFSINSSRIYANVATTIDFYATEKTNGTNILYREFTEDQIEKDRSYNTIFSEGFLKATGKTIADIFVFFATDLKGKEKSYRWIIRGSAYPDTLSKTPEQTVSKFLSTSCGLVENKNLGLQN